MDVKGPCFHCGVEESLIWRNGPPEKPILCNACGLKWRTKRTLDGYIPRRARDAQSSQTNQLLPMQNPATASFTPILGSDKTPEFIRSNTGGIDGSSYASQPFVFGAGIYPESSSGVMTVSQSNSQVHAKLEASHSPFLEPDNIPKKKRSSISMQQQEMLGLGESLQQKLLCIARQEIKIEEDPEDVLIFEHINKNMPENEIGLGCMLLKPPPSPSNSQIAEPTVVPAANEDAFSDSRNSKG